MNINFIERTNCPLCESTDQIELTSVPYKSDALWKELRHSYGDRVVDKDFDQTDFTLIECKKCDLIYQKYIPNNSILSDIYRSEEIQDESFYHEDFDQEKYLDYSREILTILNYLKKSPQHCKVLDFGLGKSRWAMVAKSIGCDVYGVEYSENLIDNAKKCGIKMIKDDEVSNYRFDLINTEQVFEHLPNPMQTLKKLKSGLAQNGIIKISVPHAKDIKSAIRRFDFSYPKYTKLSMNPIYPLEHIQFFNHKSVRIAAQRSDMKIKKIPTLNYFLFLNNWSSFKAIVKGIIKPILFNFTHKRNYFFLQ